MYAAARQPASITLPDVVRVQLDVTSGAQIAAAAERCHDVNIVVNNAGIGSVVTALSGTVAANGRARFDANVFGLLAASAAFVPVIEANGTGALVNVISMGSWRSSSPLALYSASKSAAWSLTNSLRLELQPRGIHVVGVHCGFVDTDLTAGVAAAQDHPERRRARDHPRATHPISTKCWSTTSAVRSALSCRRTSPLSTPNLVGEGPGIIADRASV